MPTFNPGESIAIRCKIQPGPFPDEFLVTVETTEGPIAGFVRKEGTIERGGERLLVGVVVKATSEFLEVRLKGSYFTTTGLADLPRDWVKTNVEPLAA